ncbi:carboxymuconolactone decarboxylase family protein [Aurantivibrio infirmus]
MKARIAPNIFYQQQSQLTQGLIDSDKAAYDSGLNIALLNLLKIRASQINGCAFCLHMHNSEARSAGEKQERLDILSAWRETPYFTDQERAALAWCEALTACSSKELSDELYELLTELFSETEIVSLTSVIVTINSWNRIVAAMRFIPDIN